MLERPISKAGWARVRFDQIATQINDRVDNPAEAGVDRYVGLEHLDPDSLRIRRWGEPTDVESTKLRFQPGDIIFGKRRVYQRKVAVADFEGICSAHAMVLRAKPGAVLPEFLPFFMQSDLFMERALSISVGSLSPTINWKALAAEEFLLPPIQEQARLVEALLAVDEALESYERAAMDAQKVIDAIIDGEMAEGVARKRLEVSAVVVTKGESPRWQGFEYSSVGIPFLTSENVLAASIDLSDLKCIPPEFHEKLRRSQIFPGDVLINIVGASIGRAAVVPDQVKEANTNQAVAVVRLDTKRLKADYLVRIFLSQRFQREMTKMLVNSARANVSLTDIRNFLIPDRAIDHQAEIIRQINGIQSAVNSFQSRARELVAIRKQAIGSGEGE